MPHLTKGKEVSADCLYGETDKAEEQLRDIIFRKKKCCISRRLT